MTKKNKPLDKHQKLMNFIFGKTCPNCKKSYMDIFSIGFAECPLCGHIEKKWLEQK